MVADFPPYEGLLDRYRADEEFANYADGNHAYWRSVIGGLALMRASPLSFDPSDDYWHCTERRVLTSFFARYFKESYAPAGAMRSLAYRVFLHFDQAREAERFGERKLATVESGLWPAVLEPIDDAASGLPEFEEYGLLREVWGRQLRVPTFRELLHEYIATLQDHESPNRFEPGFVSRLPWFPYLGLRSREALVERQRFFFGFYQAFTSTNSYGLGGSLSMAPILQNNPTDVLTEFLGRWAAGETPYDTKFVVEGKAEKKDRSHHTAVVELYGYLNLHRMPFQNGATAAAYARLVEDEDESVFDSLRRVGQQTAEWVEAHPAEAPPLAQVFRDLAMHPATSPKFRVEGIRREDVAARRTEDAQAQVDTLLVTELEAAARDRVSQLSDQEAAMAMLHLLMDSAIYTARGTAPPTDKPSLKGPEVPPESEVIRLPASLRTTANDALGYLRAGHHVLFAGPPGTGKTTLAQFVGYAWDHEATEVPDEVALSEAPVTTVGNSAWSPFHTIGGILPGEDGTFVTAKGIFIEPDAGEAGEWDLRHGSLVIDEMNRADLDRCIGELYPLLSRNVARVQPAGIPGVTSVRLHPRFRLIATVNDATLDDIVFPISEGLARRFLRIELLGATKDELDAYLAVGEADRRKAARRVIDMLFDVCTELERVESSERGEHLPFGVGYFRTLQDWCAGQIRLSPEFEERDLPDQARDVLLTSLRSAVRVRGLEPLFEQIRQAEIGA